MTKNIRFYVLLGSFLLSLLIAAFVKFVIPQGSLQLIRLTQLYALTALFYLYVSLLIGPVTYSFKFLPWRGQIHRARRAVGVSAFYFALIHASLAFFGQLGGFGGLLYLDNKYLLAISFSFVALLVLGLLTATSFDYMVLRLGKKWKLLHRLIYLAALLVLVHALMLGTHFQDLSGLIPQVFLSAFFILLVLEAIRFDAFLQRRLSIQPRFGITLVLAFGAVLSYSFISFLPKNAKVSLGIHSAHIQLAQQVQQGANNSLGSGSFASIPGLQGDRTKRYTVSFDQPEIVRAKQDVSLRFQVFDASSGSRVSLFSILNEKLVHLVIVDDGLGYFNHIHPTQDSNGFIIQTQFPKDGEYRLYLTFQPLGAIEQQFAFTLKVGKGEVESPNFLPDTNLTKSFGDYQVSLNFPSPLKASQLSIGAQNLKFTIKDKSGNPVSNLKPYLAAFGHLVMINEETFDYLHVHPYNLAIPKPDDLSGPDVEFLPIGIYGAIKPGIYRVFAQFNPDGKLFTADFTIKVE